MIKTIATACILALGTTAAFAATEASTPPHSMSGKTSKAMNANARMHKKMKMHRANAAEVMTKESMTWPSLWNGGATGGLVERLGVRQDELDPALRECRMQRSPVVVWLSAKPPNKLPGLRSVYFVPRPYRRGFCF